MEEAEDLIQETFLRAWRSHTALTWFSGRDTCMRCVSRFFGAPGDWHRPHRGVR